MAKSKSPITRTLIAMSGQENVITIYRSFVEFTGSYEGAALLSQLLYWTPKSTMGGWIAKTDAEFTHELCITQHGLRRARAKLEQLGILRTKIKRFNGTPTTHYFIVLDALSARFDEFTKSDFANSQSPFCESNKSLTEITTEINTKNSASAQISNEPEKTGGDEMQYSDPIWDIAHGKSPAAQDARQARLNQMRNAANRFSPNLQELALAFQEASGGILQEMHLKRDARALIEMLDAGVTAEIITDAIGAMQNSGLAITWPGAVTKTAIGIVNIRQKRAIAEYEAEAMKEQPAEVTPTPPGQRRRPNIRRWSND